MKTWNVTELGDEIFPNLPLAASVPGLALLCRKARFSSTQSSWKEQERENRRATVKPKLRRPVRSRPRSPRTSTATAAQPRRSHRVPAAPHLLLKRTGLTAASAAAAMSDPAALRVPAASGCYGRPALPAHASDAKPRRRRRHLWCGQEAAPVMAGRELPVLHKEKWDFLDNGNDKQEDSTNKLSSN